MVSTAAYYPGRCRRTLRSPNDDGALGWSTPVTATPSMCLLLGVVCVLLVVEITPLTRTHDRYDKYDHRYLACIHLASTGLWFQ